jgi:hypothetical protein
VAGVRLFSTVSQPSALAQRILCPTGLPDCGSNGEEDRTLRAVLVGMLREGDP